MGLGSTQMTITTEAAFIPELWIDKIVKATESNLTFIPLTWDWSSPGQQKGNKIDVPGVTNLTANSKSANTQVTLNAPIETKNQLLLNQHYECSFMLEDIAKVQASYNLMDYYTEKSGYAIASQRDTQVNALVANLTQIVGANGVDLGDVQIRNAIQFLDIGDVPQDDRFMTVYPTQKNALMGIEKYYSAYIRGDGNNSPIIKGTIGELYNIPLYISTNVATSAGTRLNCLFHRQAFATVSQEGPRVQSDYIIEYLGTVVVTDCIFGQLKARDSFGVWMQS